MRIVLRIAWIPFHNEFILTITIHITYRTIVGRIRVTSTDVVYVGRTEINGEKIYFFQVKDNRTGKVGQYPHPTDGTAEWGKLDLDAPLYNTNYSESNLDLAASDAHNCVEDYLNAEGLDYQSLLESDDFQAASEDGLKIDMKASLTGCDKLINDKLKFNYEGMVVYVSKMPSDYYSHSHLVTDFFVKTEDPATGKTGQDPQPELVLR